MQNIIPKIIGVLLIFVAILILPLKYKNKVEGTVVSSDCITTGNYRNRRRDCFMIVSYIIDNKEYKLEESTTSFGSSRRLVNDKVIVYYNSKNPQEAMVNRNTRFFFSVLVLIIALFLIFGKLSTSPYIDNYYYPQNSTIIRI
jgi:hypothetical protein